MREIGLYPNALLCRADRRIPDDERSKISLFSNVPQDAVISVWDENTIYKIPSMLHKQKLDEILLDALDIEAPAADLSSWDKLVHALENPKHVVTIGIVGKYMELTESYKSLIEALIHAGAQTESKVAIEFIDATDIENDKIEVLERLDAVLVPGGFGKRGTEGKIKAIQYARENNVPFLGICLGMQLATIEFARNVAGFGGANSTELDPSTAHPVVALVTEWKDHNGDVQKRDKNSDLGGTMRKGLQTSPVKANTLAASIYGDEVSERHRHRYEVNNVYVEQLEKAGLVFSSRTVEDNLPEIIEITDHPWFLGVQFHPEFTSKPRTGHPLFVSYIKAALAAKEA